MMNDIEVSLLIINYITICKINDKENWKKHGKNSKIILEASSPLPLPNHITDIKISGTHNCLLNDSMTDNKKKTLNLQSTNKNKKTSRILKYKIKR